MATTEGGHKPEQIETLEPDHGIRGATIGFSLIGTILTGANASGIGQRARGTKKTDMLHSRPKQTAYPISRTAHHTTRHGYDRPDMSMLSQIRAESEEPWSDRRRPSTSSEIGIIANS